jgi:hypothetical protein
MKEPADYDKIRSNAEAFYKNIDYIYSPALGENVYFGADGFNHIRFKKQRDEREKISQMARFNLLPHAIKLVGLSTTYQEYEERNISYRIKSRNRGKFISEKVYYWGIIAIIDNRKIKIVLRKVGTEGKLHFWSVIPAWTTSANRDRKLIRTTKGNPEID